ncbi:phosphoglycerate dehydrogenase [Faecalicatena sp. AGMB00832]|uniref:Phosphoglycerate dehydrogenase n=1 Tax=Faecalicatena faecalis TaxID=2726362 RepID=A0ABS6CZP5_9FIRM|nr:phosphoglycerate dehydrogenase [Faecalicatena faecalis]MBU3874789.1 phosphoglycerate dehydrogenase [Faecalicatena faecalis]
MYRVLVTSKSFAKYNPEIMEELKEKGIEIVRASASNMTSEQIADEVTDYDGLVCGIDRIDKTVMEAGRNLKVIHMNGTGVDHIDVKEATRRGIYVGNCPGANAQAVAELNLGILLCEARKIVKHSKMIDQGRWEREVGVELSGKTIGVLGLGAIGRHFVELLRGFHMRVLAYDVYPDLKWCKENQVELVEDISQVYIESDFISLNLPLLESTRGMINERSLGLMKKDVIIVNTARGGLIEADALIRALKEKRIRGAALDAFAREPLEMDSPLRELDVTMTPHIGASSIETMKNVTRIVGEHLVEVLVNGNPEHMLNA